jgi:hypothetical protein
VQNLMLAEYWVQDHNSGDVKEVCLRGYQLAVVARRDCWRPSMNPPAWSPQGSC